jgi:hypothetical protein
MLLEATTIRKHRLVDCAAVDNDYVKRAGKLKLY